MVTINLSSGGIGIFSEYAENTGDVFQGAFSDSSINSGAVTTAAFSGNSVNNGFIIEAVDFTENSLNSGFASIATFSNNAINTGTISTSAEFTGNTVNNGTVNIAAFNGNATNIGTVNLSALFTGSAVNSGIIVGNAVFADTTTNAGVVQGNAQIAPTATNSGTVSGNVTVYYPPISGHYSVIFNSTDASVEAPFNAGLDLSTSDFTIEGWIKPYSVAGQRVFLGKDNVSSLAYGSYNLYVQDGVIICSIGTADLTGHQEIVGTINVLIDKWTHIAVTRDYSANTVSLFVDGILDTTSPLTLSMGDGGRSVSLGKIATVWSGGEFVGKMSNFRIIKGQALYTSTFTVPDAAYTLTGYGLTDQSITGIVSILALQSSVIEPGLIAHGTVNISDDSPWHAASPWYVDMYGEFANSSYLYTNSTIAIGTSDFTFEAFIYPTNYDINNQSTLLNSHGYGGLAIYFQSQTGWQLAGGQNQVGNTFISTNPVSLNIWQHIAIVRLSGNTSVYINGLLESTTADTADYNDLVYDISHSSVGYGFIGKIASVRISNNARYSGSSFQVPTAAFTSDVNTTLLALNSSILESGISNVSVNLVNIAS